VQTLQDVARMTGGRYFEAGNTEGLLEAYKHIDRLERAEIPSFQYRRYHEGYPWFGLAALLVLAAGQALELTVWRRLP
jgi:Ca-activated chloride channel family protein